ncbi:extracellular solute-binding protein 3 [Tanacetum coccineum]
MEQSTCMSETQNGHHRAKLEHNEAREKSKIPTLELWCSKKTVNHVRLVKVNEYNEVEGGFSIAIFCYALRSLPYNVQPIFKPFINDKGEMNGTYDQLLKHIEGQFDNKCFALAVLEYRASNPKFASPLYRQLVMVIWFPISTFFFHEGKILNRCSKVVLVMWLCMIFIVVQIFTATLSSWLTLDQLSPRLPTSYENVGYQGGSFIKDLIIQRYNCSGEKTHYGSEYMKFGPINQESGIAFAFASGSPLLQPFSRAVINVTESETMMDMKKKYLGFSTHNKPQPNQPLPQSLDVQSFIGLFIFMGIVTSSRS